MSRYRRSSRARTPMRRQAAPLPLGETLSVWLSARGQDARALRLNELWKNWTMVMGPDLAPLAQPLGHRGDLLLVGGEDNLVLQELSYAVPEILERVNAFMDEAFFQRVELRLVFGRTPLNLAASTPVPGPPPLARPPRLGGLSLDPESPVGRCYQAYLRCFGTPPDADSGDDTA